MMEVQIVQQIFRRKIISEDLIFFCSIEDNFFFINFLNRITWLFKSSDIIYPSVYLSEKLPQRSRAGLVRGRVRESLRLSKRVSHQPKTLTYIRYVYTDTRRVLTESDLLTALQTMRSERSDGVVLWGSSNDLNSR